MIVPGSLWKTESSRIWLLINAVRGDGIVAQLIRFVFVGGISNTLYLVAFLLIRNQSTQLANLVGALVSALIANELHRRLTFHAASRVSWLAAQSRGLLAAGVGLALSSTAIAVFDQTLPQSDGSAMAVLLVVVNVTVGALRFLLLRGWVFRSVRVRPNALNENRSNSHSA